MVEGARLESVFRGNSNVGSNPTLSASLESTDCLSRPCNIVQMKRPSELAPKANQKEVEFSTFERIANAISAIRGSRYHA